MKLEGKGAPLGAPFFAADRGEWSRRPNRKESLYVTSFRYQTR